MLSDETYKFIFDNISAIVFIWHPQHRLQYVSPYTKKAIGYTPEELVGGQAVLEDIMHVSQFDRILQNLTKIIMSEPGKSFSEYVCCRHKNGQAVWLNMAMSKQLNAAGETILVGNGQVVSDPNDSRRAEKRVRLLHNISLSLNTTIDLHDFGNMVMYQLICEDSITAAALYLHTSSESDALKLVNLQWTGLTNKRLGDHPPSQKEFLHLEENTPSSDTSQLEAIHIGRTEPKRVIHPIFKKVQEEHPNLKPIKACLIAPLLIENEKIGEIAIGRDEEKSFTPAEEILMTIIAQMIAGSVDYIERLQKERHEHQLSDKLREVLAVLVRSLDLEKTLTVILEKLDDLLEFDSATVYLLEPDQSLKMVSSRRLPNAKQIKEQVASVGGFPLDKTILSDKKPLALEDVRHNTQWKVLPGTEYIRSWLGVPLIYQDAPIGLVTIDRSKVNPFTTEQIDLARTFAGYAAIAISNARLFSQTQKQQKRMRTLSNRVVEAQEEERRRISQELHDEMGQSLTALKMNLTIIMQNMPDSLPDLKASLGEQVDLTGKFLDDVRRLAVDLRPSILDDLGLEPALQWLVKQTQKGLNTEFSFSISPDFPRLDSTIETALYRVVQEALTNISRHAKATEADIVIWQTSEAVFCHISDNGNGFDLNEVQHRKEPKGIGLVGIRERIEALNGQVIFKTKSQEGTSIEIEIPLIEAP